MTAGDDITVHRLNQGARGPVVVFAHGLEDAWDCWLPLARRLGRTWRMHLLDLPWRAGGRYAWRRAGSPADWLARGLHGIGERVDVLVAHSFGANATLELLTARSAVRPVAVALVAPFYRPSGMDVTWEVFERSRENFDRQIRAGVAVRLGERASKMDPDILNLMMDKAVDRIGPAGFLTVFDQFVASGDLDLSTVDVPTLVLAGRGDPGLGRYRSKLLAEAMPAASVVLDDDYDHFCHIRRADDVARRLTDFVAAAGVALDTAAGPVALREGIR